MNVLVGCETSGTVRDAFRRLGHNAWSCDTLPCDADPAYHWQGDLNQALAEMRPGDWDLFIAHPPCTDLCVSGAEHFKWKRPWQEESLDFVRRIMAAPVPRIAIENPVGVISTRIRPPEQIINPYEFGHSERKRTCLWLKNLPPLVPTCLVTERNQTLRFLPPSAERWKLRSKTFQGIADAMATQWGRLPVMSDSKNEPH